MVGLWLGCLSLLGPFAFINASEEQDETFLEENLQDGCTVIMVGKKASIDGSVITTHTADCSVCDFTWRHVPAADHEPGEARKIYCISQIRTWPPEVGLKWDMIKENYTGVEIPEVLHTYAYLHGVFGYMNEHQLAMAESTIGCRLKMRNPTPAAIFDITTLTMIAIERCKTARDAIRLMGSLAEKYGYGFHDSGEMLAVADPNEVWVFEIMPVGPLWTPKSGKPGAVWCAQRIPDDHISVCPNESRMVRSILIIQTISWLLPISSPLPSSMATMTQRVGSLSTGRKPTPLSKKALQAAEGHGPDSGALSILRLPRAISVRIRPTWSFLFL